MAPQTAPDGGPDRRKTGQATAAWRGGGGGAAAAGAWTPLGGAPVALQVDGGSASAEFGVDVPQGAPPAGAPSTVEAS